MGYVNPPFRWWTGLSPRRRILLGALALVVAVAAVVTGALASGGAPKAIPGRPGVVLLVPGYGGSATSLDELAARIRANGRTATMVALAGDGTGDLTVQARVLDGYLNRAIGAGSGPVTVIGYSAGGVVAWLWYVDYGGASRTGKIITLGSPLHGARIAAVGTMRAGREVLRMAAVPVRAQTGRDVLAGPRTPAEQDLIARGRGRAAGIRTRSNIMAHAGLLRTQRRLEHRRPGTGCPSSSRSPAPRRSRRRPSARSPDCTTPWA
jgi:pimeloyl-ACP methyl ester carboxylesterase